jgi:hypothetical protein
MHPSFFGAEFVSGYDSFHKKWLLWTDFLLLMAAIYLTIGYVFWNQPYSSWFQYSFAGAAALEFLASAWYSARRCIMTYFLDAFWVSIVIAAAIWAVLENEIGTNTRFQYALYVFMGTSFLYFATWTQRLSKIDVAPHVTLNSPAREEQPGSEADALTVNSLDQWHEYAVNLHSEAIELCTYIDDAKTLADAKKGVTLFKQHVPKPPRPPKAPPTLPKKVPQGLPLAAIIAADPPEQDKGVDKQREGQVSSGRVDEERVDTRLLVDSDDV